LGRPCLRRRGARRDCDPSSDPVSEGDEVMIRQSCALVSHAASAVVEQGCFAVAPFSLEGTDVVCQPYVLLARAHQLI
jgi:hypothetical protein